MAEIQLERVSQCFRDGTVTLSDVSLTIRDGEFFILVGPSGCGKSTLLNLIVGLEKVTTGEIRVDGRVVNDLDPKDRDMAMVFQNYAIYPHMSVRENLAFPLLLAKLPAMEISKRVEEAAAILELSGLLDRKPASLSGGQRQRVAMGRAIVRKPLAFLLDEPLSNLDAGLRVQMRSEIARLQNRLGVTMIYVTHDQTEAMTLGDRVAVLNRGVVQQIGTPQALYQRPANRFVAGFIGSPGMNFFPARVDGRWLVLPMGSVALPDNFLRNLPDDRGSVVAGIRPEHFRHGMPAGDPGSGLSFDAAVELVEWLGAEIFLHFNAGSADDAARRSADDMGPSRWGNRAVARLPGSENVRRGSSTRLFVDAEDVQLFDSDSGCNLVRTV